MTGSSVFLAETEEKEEVGEVCVLDKEAVGTILSN